jgi:hypothetical protein
LSLILKGHLPMMGILISILMVIAAWGTLGTDLFLVVVGVAALWGGSVLAHRYFIHTQRDNAARTLGGLTLIVGIALLIVTLLGFAKY